ncbi:MAG: permease [Nitriliruptoraceae bacterium]
MDFDRVTETVGLFGSLLASLLVLFIPITIGLVLFQRWLGTQRLARLLGGDRLLPALLKGTLLGAVTPFCGCSTIPLLLGLIRARVRFAGVAAFMLASPLLNPYILGVVVLLFGTQTAVVYAGFAAATAIGLGAVWELAGLERHLVPGVSPRVPRPEAVPVGAATLPQAPVASCGQDDACSTGDDDAAPTEDPAWAGWGPELRAAYDSALETLRPMVRPLLLGVTIGALVYGFVPEGWLAGVLGTTTWWTLPLAAVLGLPLYLRGEAAFPIGAGLLAAGVGEGPMFAMVIAGMGASLPEVTILSGIFQRRLLAAFLASVFATAVLGGVVIPAVT